MPTDRPTFSDTWYRLAPLTPRLRSTVQIYRQFFRGKLYYVVEDPTGNQYFRLDEAGYFFVGLLDGRRTIEQAWLIANEKLGDAAPTQGEATRLLGQMYSSNLLGGDVPPDAAGMFERFRRRKAREVRGYLTNLLFIRIPLFDPDRILNTFVGAFGWMFSWFGFALWALLLLVGGYFVIGDVDTLFDQSKNVLSPSNLFLLYVAMVFIKTFHEFGHGFACKRFGLQNGNGGEVHTMGIMLLVFMPVPYVDASSSWAFRSKWQRIVVAAAGMYIELGIAAIAAIVWANTADGTAIHAVAYNMIFIASVTTLLFNANPLLRYDGYYILSDLIEIPNLSQRSKDYIYYLVKKFAYGVRRPRDPSGMVSERPWLVFYGIASFFYRIFISVRILLFVTDQLPQVGVPLAIVAVVTWVIVPIGKWIKYLANSPELARTRQRAALATVSFFLLIGVLFGAIPVPDRNAAQGVVEPRDVRGVFVLADGFLEHTLRSSERVRERQPLIEAENQQLVVQRASLVRSLELLDNMFVDESVRDPMKANEIQTQFFSTRDRIRRIDQYLESLQAPSPIDGVWVTSPAVYKQKGGYVEAGQQVGMVASTDDLIIRVPASQALGPRIRDELPDGAAVEICVMGRPGEDDRFAGVIEKRSDAAAQDLPSKALGYLAGGEIQTEMDDQEGTKAAEHVFDVVIRPTSTPESGMAIRPGQRVMVRFTMASRPLAWQWYRDIRLLIQRKFQL